MRITRYIFQAGKTLVCREQPKRRVTKKGKRAPKQNLTSDEVWRNNLKNAIFKLTLILNHNFEPGDHHLQLTYSKEPSKEEAKKDRERFVRKLRQECQKVGLEAKWVAVTHHNKKRIHHHIVCAYVPMEIVAKCWPHGTVFHNPLWDNPNYKDLADYLLREAAREHEKEEKIFKRRYNSSRNVVMPQCKEEEISGVDLTEAPTPEEGYYIDGEIERYEHIITRLTCREYIQVQLNIDKPIKKRRKGRVSKLEKINYSRLLREAYNEHQESLDVFCNDKKEGARERLSAQKK